MKTYPTLEQAMKTKKAVVLSTEDFQHQGQLRKSIRARKAQGKRVYYVTQYENGLFSEAV